MALTTTISAQEMHRRLDDPNWLVFDCRFSLDEPERGRQAYLAGHIPGAQYADLDRDLSGPILPGRTGRHPLPAVEVTARRFSEWGIESGSQVVVYDDAGGAYAARLWWMLRWLGHPRVALLDGGWAAWQRGGFPIRAGEERRPAAEFSAAVQEAEGVDVEALVGNLAEPRWTLVDSRAPERHRGELEPIDPVAGHIPGSLNAPHADVLDPDGYLLPPAVLKTHFESLLAGSPPERTVFYCGSGVSAALNLVAMELAGLPGAKLYPGSWSEWITDPERPVEAGGQSPGAGNQTKTEKP